MLKKMSARKLYAELGLHVNDGWGFSKEMTIVRRETGFSVNVAVVEDEVSGYVLCVYFLKNGYPEFYYEYEKHSGNMNSLVMEGNELIMKLFGGREVDMSDLTYYLGKSGFERVEE